MYADENVIKIKHEVLYEVAKLAFAGELEEKRDHIATELIPGPLPQFRCCIYKSGKSSASVSGLQKGKPPAPAMTATSFRSSAPPVKTARFPATR